MNDRDRSTCPNCGAKPLNKNYPDHVEACRGDPPSIVWYWSEGNWRDKVMMGVITISVILLSVVAKAKREVEGAWQETKEEAEI